MIVKLFFGVYSNVKTYKNLANKIDANQTSKNYIYPFMSDIFKEIT